MKSNINFTKKLKAYKKNPISLLLYCLVMIAAVITILALFFIVFYILVKGVPHLTPSLFALEYNTQNVSMFPAIITTIMMTVIALVIAVPLGIFTAIYLVEYSNKGNKLVAIIQVTTETLSGIPSIVYGLFGLLFFVTTLNLGYSLISGALTLSIMILPLVIRTTEEALKSVSDSFREASFGLGAGKLRTVFKVVLPSAGNGILAGVILAIGRIVGETAALIYTAGTVAQIPMGLAKENFFLLESGRTLAVHMYALSSEGMYTNQAYATAVVLLIIVIVINLISSFIAKKFTKGNSI